MKRKIVAMTVGVIILLISCADPTKITINNYQKETEQEKIEPEKQVIEEQEIIIEPVIEEPEIIIEPVIKEPEIIIEPKEPEKPVIIIDPEKPVIEEPVIIEQEPEPVIKEPEIIIEPEPYNYLKINNKSYIDLMAEEWKLSTSNDSELDGIWESESGEMFQFISRKDFKYWDKSNKNGERVSGAALYKSKPTLEGSIKTYYNYKDNDNLFCSGGTQGNYDPYLIITKFKFIDCNWEINGYSKELRLGNNLEIRFIKRALNKEPVFDY